MKRTRAAVSRETPIKSKPFIFDLLPLLSMSFGMSHTARTETGTAIIATNQKTQDHVANSTKMAPMKSPSTVKAKFKLRDKPRV